MSFLFPAFLLGLIALIIPIIIHLFSFRRFKKVEFTNVKFLKEVKEETASRAKIKHLLVLFSRMLAIAFLVFAFAQPFIKSEDTEVKKGSKAVSIFIDNSFSMKAMSKDMSLFEKAKQKASEISQAYSVGDRFQIITNDFDGSQQRLIPQEDVEANIEATEISPATRKLSKVIERQKQAFKNSEAENKIIYILSDFQEGFTDAIVTDTNYTIYFVPLATVNEKNVFVDSVWFANPIQFLNQAQNLLVRIKNSGSVEVDRSQLTLRINDQVKSIKEFSLEAGETAIDTVNFMITETGWHKSEVVINDFPITFDDSYYFSFNVAEKVNILGINQAGKNRYLSALFANNDYFQMNQRAASQLDYSVFGEQQLIILNGVKNIASGLTAELETYVSNGGNLLVFPNIALEKVSYDNLSRSLGIDGFGTLQKTDLTTHKINTQEEIFDDVFERIRSDMALPKVKQHYTIKRFTNNSESLLSFKAGNSFLLKYRSGQGKVYLCASPLDDEYSELPINAIFVPMVFKMALSGNRTDKLAYMIGDNNTIEVNRQGMQAEMIYKMQGPQQEFIPQQNAIGSRMILGMNNQVQKAGMFDLFAEGFEPAHHFGFNYNRNESVMRYATSEDLKDKYSNSGISILKSIDKNLTDVVGNLDQGIILWKLCIILALLFLAFEVLLLKLWK